MHYYQFNIADYRKDTVHLTPLEHYIYRTLIDWYYLDECKIPKKTQSVLRRLQLGFENETDLLNILDEFFTEADDGWFHSRIDADILAYQQKSTVNAENGRKGGRPKKAKQPENNPIKTQQQKTESEINPTETQSVNLGYENETEKKPNQEPLTNNHKPIKNTLSIAGDEPRPLGGMRPLPDDFLLTDDMVRDAKAHWLPIGRTDLDPQREFELFVAHYRGQGSQSAHWPSEWKKWVIRAVQFNRPAISAPNQRGQPQANSTRGTSLIDDLNDRTWAGVI